MSHNLPKVQNIREAIDEVIESEGPNATALKKFRAENQNEPDSVLVRKLSKWIENPPLETLEKEAKKFPGTLRLEDFVCRYGLGFDKKVIERACATVEYLKSLG